MITQTVKFTNPFTNEEETETLHFNLTVAELLDLEAETDGGLEATMAQLEGSNDAKLIINTFKMFVEKAYGKRKGSSFVKNQEILDEFMGSEQYSAFFMDLLADPNAAAAFVANLIPKDMQSKLDRIKSEQGDLGMGLEADRKRQHPGILSQPEEDGPKTPPDEEKTMTKAELVSLPTETVRQRIAEGWTIVD